MVNPSAKTVREIDNQNLVYPFRTNVIGTSGQISGGGTFNFHASGFSNRTNVQQLIFVGNTNYATNYNVEFFMTSSLVSSERQYYYQNINLRTIDLPQRPIPIFDSDATNCLHGRITNNITSGNMNLLYIDLKYNKLLEVS